MQDIRKGKDKGLTHGIQISHGDGTAVKLAVEKLVLNDARDHFIHAVGHGFFQRAGGGLDAVGQHQHGHFAGAGLAAVIAEAVLQAGVLHAARLFDGATRDLIKVGCLLYTSRCV